MSAQDEIGALIIRNAAICDCRALEGLIAQLGYEAGEADIAARLAAMEQEEPVVLVAELDGAVVGCLSTSVMRVLHRRRRSAGSR